MRVKTLIRLADQLAVEPLFADARFVPRNEQDRLPLCVESKSNSPLAVGRAEAQFLHIRVARTVQRVNPRTP